jgi:unsaturated rhamnogalacturonyl hydrolase
MNQKDTAKIVMKKTLNMALQYPEEQDINVNVDGYRWANWDWNIGVAFYGLIQANRLFNDKETILKIKRWIDSRIDRGIKKICVNTTAPLAALLYINEKYPDPKYSEVFKKFDDYLMNEIPRISNSSITHTTYRSENAGQVWADTLFMSILYLSQRGAFLNSPDLKKEALNQTYYHMKALFDESSGLFYHGYNDNAKEFIGVKWGRGNAWITSATIDILKNINENSAEKTEILAMLDRQLSSLEKLQDKDGFWKTVLDADSSYQETTVTSGAAYGTLKGIRLGMVNPKYKKMADRAVSALLTKIDPDGIVQGGSSGTPIKKDAEAYNQIPYAVTPFSQGLALMALSEAV